MVRFYKLLTYDENLHVSHSSIVPLRTGHLRKSAMDIINIPPYSGNLLNVIIETPRHSSAKYYYRKDWDIFLLKKQLPPGLTFPFDFGFVPNTIAGDGDPVDVLVITELAVLPGCLVQCRPIGLLEAEQSEKQEKGKKRNDRIVAIPDCSTLYANINNVDDLDRNLLESIAHFFVTYNDQENKSFTPLRWRNGKAASRLVETSSTYINDDEK